MPMTSLLRLSMQIGTNLHVANSIVETDKDSISLRKLCLSGYCVIWSWNSQGGLISLILRFLKSKAILSALKVAIGPEFVIG